MTNSSFLLLNHLNQCLHVGCLQQKPLCPRITINSRRHSCRKERARKKREHEIVSHPEKELYFLTGWIVIMTVLLNRLMRRTVLLKSCVPSLWGLNSFVLGRVKNWTQALSLHCTPIIQPLHRLKSQNNAYRRTSIQFTRTKMYFLYISAAFKTHAMLHWAAQFTTEKWKHPPFAVGGPIKHTKGMNFNQGFAYFTQLIQSTAMLFFFFRKREDLFPSPSRAELQTPTFTVVSCLTEPAHVILQGWVRCDLSWPTKQNKAFFALF